MRVSLGIRLGFWLALLGAVFTALTGYYVYDRSRELLIKSSQERLLTATQVLAQHFSNSLRDISADVSFVASLPMVQRMADETAVSPLLPDQKKRLAHIFSGLIRAHSDYSEIRLIGAANYGRELVRVDEFGKGHTNVRTITGSALQEKGYYPYFFETLRLSAGQFYVSKITLDREQGAHHGYGKAIIRVATPIFTKTGTSFGIVIIDVDMQDLFEQIRADIPSGLRLILTNQEGDYLIHPDPAKTFGFDRGRQFLVQDDLPEMKPIVEGGVTQTMLKIGSGIGFGPASLAAFERIPFGASSEKRYVILGLYTPQDNVLAKSEALGVSVIQFAVLFIVLAILAALFLGRLLAKPLNSMARAIHQHELGEHLDVLPVERGDEVGDLARSFRAMIARINEQMREIKATEATLQMQIDRMPIGLIVWDRDFCVRTWNPAATKVFGFTEAEALGKHPYELIVPQNTKPHVEELWRRLLNGDLTAYSINENITRDDRKIVCEWTNTPMVNDDGTITSVLSMVQDITERTKAQAELQHAKEQAEEASRAKSMFLSNMSHEIRTPMNTIVGMTQLALRNEHDPKQIDYLNKVIQSSEHLLGIIDDILDFSKIEAGKLTLEKSDFNLDQVWQTLRYLAAWRANEKGIKLRFDVESDIPHNLCGDLLRLNQVLLNYVNNAIKFTKQGEIVVRARMLEENDSNIILHFEVQDTGIGISQEQRASLYQPFQQGDSSTSRIHGGTGLGLIISKRLVELMGGETGFESEPGVGSTFWLTVRMDTSATHSAVNKENEKKENAELAAMAALRGKRILVAEDHPFNQIVVKEFLENSGATVSTACNGEEALELLRSENFDCVLMDIQMPVMDGLEATRQIRADPTLAEIPILALTANAYSEDRERCMAAGMNDFISKPIKADDFYQTIANCLSNTPPVNPAAFHGATQE
jgi:PAS domain S-box-containing protein